MSNLIVASHPDDEILGCGGLIKKLSSKGEKVYVFILTLGADTRYPKEMEATLRDNALEANKVVGATEVIFADFPNQKLDCVPLLDLIVSIENKIKELKVTNLFTHHGGDLNKDHRVTYEASLTAARPVKGQFVKKFFSYFVPSSSEWNQADGANIFKPNYFLDIREELDHKIEAMKIYASEARPYPHPRSPEALRVYSNYWGISAGLEFAEPFILLRSVVDEL